MNRIDLNSAPWREFDYPRLLETGLAGEWPAGSGYFTVEEIPLYPFSGDGEHAALSVEKVDMTTRDLALAVADALGVGGAAVGYAGMKDRDAVTLQAFTITGVDEEKAARAFTEAGAKVISATRHRNKLRLGHLAGNRFLVRLRGGDIESASKALEELTRLGLPNYFGPQRFGARGDNAREGYRFLAGEVRRKKVGRWKRDLIISALQSLLFNEVLARRIEAGDFRRVISGDLLKKHDSGGIFISEEVEVDQPRLDSFEVSPTGPIFGKKMKSPEGAIAEAERGVLDDFGLAEELFGRETGSRKELRAPVAGASASEWDEGVELTFTLMPGVYATSLVREIAKSGVFRV
ncbi:MAG: tRNA pseudouridine(13) synthase TruD [Deltaproteobacteria bacterium]|nr:MAG: tRNA pseudouridine(13) synthase TruD [Deltaproteobacteria bacterium]